MAETEYIEEQSGEIKKKDTFLVLDHCPIPIESLPDESQMWVEPRPGINQHFVTLQEEYHPEITKGFVLITTEDENPNEGKLNFLYVLPEHRGKGLGRQIKTEMYEWAKEKGIEKLYSGISTVIKLKRDGTVDKIEKTNHEGNWISYKSRKGDQLSDGRRPVQRVIGTSVEHGSGYVNLVFETDLLGKDGEELGAESPTLPDTPEDLWKYLNEQVLPEGVQMESFFKHMGVSYFFRGKEVSQQEYLTAK